MNPQEAASAVCEVAPLQQQQQQGGREPFWLVIPLDATFIVFEFLSVTELFRALDRSCRHVHTFLSPSNHRLWNHFWRRYRLELMPIVPVAPPKEVVSPPPESDLAAVSSGEQKKGGKPPPPPTPIVGLHTDNYLNILYTAGNTVHNRSNGWESPAVRCASAGSSSSTCSAASTGLGGTTSSGSGGGGGGGLVRRLRGTQLSVGANVKRMAQSGADKWLELLQDLNVAQRSVAERSGRVPQALKQAASLLCTAFSLEDRLAGLELCDIDATREVGAEFAGFFADVSQFGQSVNALKQKHFKAASKTSSHQDPHVPGARANNNENSAFHLHGLDVCGDLSDPPPTPPVNVSSAYEGVRRIATYLKAIESSVPIFLAYSSVSDAPQAQQNYGSLIASCFAPIDNLSSEDDSQRNTPITPILGKKKTNNGDAALRFAPPATMEGVAYYSKRAKSFVLISQRVKHIDTVCVVDLYRMVADMESSGQRDQFLKGMSQSTETLMRQAYESDMV